LEKIAEIFYELGFVIDNEFKNNVLEKSLTLFEYLNHTSLTYSHDRITKMEKIRALLNQ
jgi:flagellin-specific chaperone FliS